MKLSSVLLRADAKVPDLSVTRLTTEHHEMSYEAGIVTVVRRERDEPPFLIPLSCVACMRPEPKAAKKLT